MPTRTEGRDSKLIDLFLSEYEDGTWARDLSVKQRPEAEIDGGVDKMATRKADGLELAIEHTLIEPFIGEKTDFHSHFRALQDILRADSSIGVPGFFIHVNLPERAVPQMRRLRGIANDMLTWLRREQATFSEQWTTRRCPCPHHPDGELMLMVSKVPFPGNPSKVAVAIQRHGPLRVGDTVEKALRQKLPKLRNVKADRRLLILERDQGWVTPELIRSEVERLRQKFPDLSSVDELWIMDTATFGEPDQYVAFRLDDAATGRNIEALEFYDGKLFAKFKNGMPVFAAMPGV